MCLSRKYPSKICLVEEESVEKMSRRTQRKGGETLTHTHTYKHIHMHKHTYTNKHTHPKTQAQKYILIHKHLKEVNFHLTSVNL